MAMKCVICNTPATYDSPEQYCDEHWAEWWASAGETPEECALIKEETLKYMEYLRLNPDPIDTSLIEDDGNDVAIDPIYLHPNWGMAPISYEEWLAKMKNGES